MGSSINTPPPKTDMTFLTFWLISFAITFPLLVGTYYYDTRRLTVRDVLQGLALSAVPVLNLVIIAMLVWFWCSMFNRWKVLNKRIL